MNQTENNRPLVDGVPALERKLEEVRRAQEQFATFSQEQVDRIFQAAALAANHARLPLAKMAVEETGMGVVAFPRIGGGDPSNCKVICRNQELFPA